MPQVVAVVYGVLQYIFTAGSWYAAFAKFVIYTAASTAISRALARKSGIGSLRSLGTEVNVRDPAAPRQIIYGQRRVSGVLYPVGTSGTNNEYLHLLLLVAGHEVEELGDVTFGDEVVPLDGSGNATGRFAGFARVLKHTGAYNQTVDTSLQTDLTAGYWSNNHRLQGIAYLYIRLKVSADLFPGGIPELYCLVKGRKVYDHRDGTHDAADLTTWDWSANAALCLVDWVRGVPVRNSAGTIVRNYGVGALDVEINTTDSDAAANICDENVVLDDLSTEDRYTCNGIISTNILPGDGIELLKAAMAGECIYVSGKWVILAGAYRSPTLAAFDDGDLRAPLTGVRLKPATTDIYNVGRGLYVSSGNNWQPTDLPQVTNATYKTQDGGEDLPIDLEFPFTTSSPTGQRLLKIAMERSRQGISFVAKCKLNAWQVRPGDVIEWTDADLGWSAKDFEVLGVALAVEPDANGNPYMGVDLTLRETASAVWTWADGEETVVDAAPNTSLRSPFDIANPTGLSVSNSVQQQAEGTAVPRLQVSWTAPADANVTARGVIRMEYKLAAASDWLPGEVIRGDITVAFILAVVIGQSYNVRIRSETDLAIAQTWVTSGSTAVTGDTTAPSAPSGLAASVGTGKAVSLDWSDNTEDDFSEYKVFRHTANDSAASSEIAEVRASRFVDIDVTLGTPYYYWLKAVDTSENVSGFSSGVNATPTTVADGSVDQTVPGTPSAPTFVSEATYLAGDGTAYARVTIACPALPSNGKVNQVLYRVSGATLWTIGDESFAAGNHSIGDLSPNTAYEFAIRSLSFSNVPSAVSSVLSRTAPNKSATPSAPSSASVNNPSGTSIEPVFVGGAQWFVSVVRWTHSTDTDLAYTELKATGTDSDGATDYSWFSPGAGSAGIVRIAKGEPPACAITNSSAGAGYVRIRSIDRTGNASSWVSVGNANSACALVAGNMAEQNDNAVEVTGIKTGTGSSVQKVLARYINNVSVTLAGGAATETFDVDLTNRGFSTRPDSGHITTLDPLYVCTYDPTSGSSTSSNARCMIRATDGTNIPATTTPMSVTFEEKD